MSTARHIAHRVHDARQRRGAQPAIQAAQPTARATARHPRACPCSVCRPDHQPGHTGAAFERAPGSGTKTYRSWAFSVEPPIGIEPMTYALRGGLEPFTAVQAVTTALLAWLLIPPASLVVQGVVSKSVNLAQPILPRVRRLPHPGRAVQGRPPTGTARPARVRPVLAVASDCWLQHAFQGCGPGSGEVQEGSRPGPSAPGGVRRTAPDVD